jgi:HEPN domain-containing protein
MVTLTVIARSPEVKVDTVMDYAEYILNAEKNLRDAYNLMQEGKTALAAVAALEAVADAKMAYTVIKHSIPQDAA